jgi:hypothetical protein
MHSPNCRGCQFPAAATALARCRQNVHILGLSRLELVATEIELAAAQIALARRQHAAVAGALRAISSRCGPLAQGRIALLRAAVADAGGDAAAARQELHTALRHFAHCGAGHFAAAAKFRLGHLDGSEKSDNPGNEAIEWCRQQGIVRVEAFFGYLAPWASRVDIKGQHIP